MTNTFINRVRMTMSGEDHFDRATACERLAARYRVSDPPSAEYFAREAQYHLEVALRWEANITQSSNPNRKD